MFEHTVVVFSLALNVWLLAVRWDDYRYERRMRDAMRRALDEPVEQENSPFEPQSDNDRGFTTPPLDWSNKHR